MQGAEVNFAQINSDGSSGDEDSALDDSDSEFHLENSALALACDALVVAARQQAEADDEMEAASTDGGSFVAPSVTTRQQFQDYQRQQLNPIMPSQTRPIGAGVEPADQESPVKAFKSKRQVYAGKPITRAIIQGGKRKFPCTYEGCGKVFSTSGHMTRHYRIHRYIYPFFCVSDANAISGQKTFKCLIPDCTSYFSRHDNMKQVRVTTTPAHPARYDHPARPALSISSKKARVGTSKSRRQGNHKHKKDLLLLKQHDRQPQQGPLGILESGSRRRRRSAAPGAGP